jgi:hypothetical protein
MSGVGVGLGALLLKGGARINKSASDHVAAIANVRAQAIAGAFHLQNERENRQHVSDMTDKIHGYAADHTEVNYGNINYTRRPSETVSGEVVPNVEGGSHGSAQLHPATSKQFVNSGPTKSMEDSHKEYEMMVGGTRKSSPASVSDSYGSMGGGETSEKPKSEFAGVQRSDAQFPSMPSESSAPSEALTSAGKPGAGRKPAAAKAPRAPKAAK